MSDEGTVTGADAAAPEVSGEATGTVEATTTESTPAWDPKTDTDFMQKLEKFDPAALPESVRRKVEQPFQQDYTRKTQAFAEMRDRWIEGMFKQAGQAPPPRKSDAFAELREKLNNGDYSELGANLQQAVRQEIKPIAEQLAQQNAFTEAQKLHPYITQREGEIAQFLASNPRLAQLAYAGGSYENLPTILHGIALKIENDELKAKTSPQAIEEMVKSRVAQALAKANGVPASTSKVGQAATATRGKSYANIKDAMEDAWSQALASRKVG